ncbi:hypothetical protein Tco_0173477 [Tanacetum coccineum]
MEVSTNISRGEESTNEDASDIGAAPKQQQQVIPQTTAISNIKLPILKKEEYDIWAMEMEHYLEYIDNEIQAVEKERKAKNILLMAIPKEHMRRFHGMDDAKEIWEAIRTRFGGNANSKNCRRCEVSTEDANHKFLRSLPPAWSNLAMTMRTNPEIDTLSIDDCDWNKLMLLDIEEYEHSIGKIAMIAIRMKKFYRKQEGVPWMEKHLLDLTKRSLSASIVTTLVHFARVCTAKRGHLKEEEEETHCIKNIKIDGKQKKNQMGFADNG